MERPWSVGDSEQETEAEAVAVAGQLHLFTCFDSSSESAAKIAPRNPTLSGLAVWLKRVVSTNEQLPKLPAQLFDKVVLHSLHRTSAP